MKFNLGQVVATPAALDAMQRAGTNMIYLLSRHVNGDWGNVCPEDAKENDFSVESGFRIMSVYPLNPSNPDRVVWVITEADRSATTFLLPEDY
jgi:hypothetical protein